MRIHLINPSHISFGMAVITPRWPYVLAEATPRHLGDPLIVDETLAPFEPARIEAGDVVGISIHTGNALRGYEVGRIARERGARVVYGGIHATLYPDEAHERGFAHAVVKGDGEGIWPHVLEACAGGRLEPFYEGGRVAGQSLRKARWDLLPRDRYMFGSVQTVRGCPKHCSFCSVWRTDGQEPRQRTTDAVVEEIVELRRMGFRFVTLADDNFYPVTLEDLAQARRRKDPSRLRELEALRAERFELMERLARLPSDTVFYTQITMEAAEDPAFLEAMRDARIRGALIGVESVSDEGLNDVYKDFNLAGDALISRLREFKRHGVHVLGSFIFGLPSDRRDTFRSTAALAREADIDFAQFLTLTPFPGTVDFQKWERTEAAAMPKVDGVPLSRYWLIPQAVRPKIFSPHPAMTAEDIRIGTQSAWDHFYRLSSIWRRSASVKSLKGRLAYVLVSKLYRQMYANTGIATDSARVSRAATWASLLARPLQRLFAGRPMPDLQVPDPPPVAPDAAAAQPQPSV